MEKLLNPYEKQYMKMAMLKHEETFKQQVNELHRLYQVQKILMENMQINKGNNVSSGLETFNRTVDHETDRLARRDSGGNNTDIMDESEIELTLGPSCYSGELMRMNKKNKNSLPEMIDENLNSDGWSFWSSSTGSSNNNHNNLEEQVIQEKLMKHQNQKQPWLRALTLNII
ncbi:hypothetical protein BRARA_I00850 [Brassica rapa]|uniref:MYB-CC type transcription factor LHEQLE-containing domain-containing protein n=3 Tax=Brassica TaxID=3705 RepID=A0ABQ8BWX8_BRANA|nr:uncharacterized protein LOC103837754 [Brassica rapa]XP_022566078.2 uncharacterized protein BNAC09G07310D [Brassica napus]KAG5382247.1 hypothetical protein IGI04_033717 [Brassica rapa subsp. trilocularis]KAH0908992.1 hypothetical protein HID58_032313 [Brassica napus]RID44024.1 hypothetical protein BRARA_I00850 [Brassica rapa]CAG7860516.1 unnamed protein product [Brassica rapa]VDC58977.1 unnamed protein product [Brassica rapa]